LENFTEFSKELMKEQAYNPLLELAEQTMDRYQETVRTGLKLQEEVRDQFLKASSNPDWQKSFSRTNGMMFGMMPSMQRQAEELLGMMGRNSQLFLEYYMKAMKAEKMPSNPLAQTDWMDVAKRSMESMFVGAEAVSELRNRAMESWMESIKESMKNTNSRD
jgi:hypothetical protein